MFQNEQTEPPQSGGLPEGVQRQSKDRALHFTVAVKYPLAYLLFLIPTKLCGLCGGPASRKTFGVEEQESNAFQFAYAN